MIMVYRLQYFYDKIIDDVLDESIVKYNEFYGTDLNKDVIKIYIVEDRETFDKTRGFKTENWMKAHAKGTHIYIFDLNVLEDVSGGFHKRDDDQYIKTIKHEIAHSFYWSYLNGKYFRANWLNEGMSIYLSGQLSDKIIPEKFQFFLDYWSNEGLYVYKESGFVVQILIEKYGKDKILELIKCLGFISTQEDFFVKFKDIFGFELSYDSINKLFFG